MYHEIRHLKICEWFLTYSQHNATISAFYFQDVFITPKRTASSFAVTPSPAPAPLIYLRSQQRRLFWTSHINGITQYVTFCV